MRTIKRKLFITIFLLVVSLTLSILFISNEKLIETLLFGILDVGFIILSWSNYQNYCKAKLISDNSIFTVPSAIIFHNLGKSKETVAETVISTFGILINGRTINWGTCGKNGVNLQKILVDRIYISFAWGNQNKQTLVKLPHGLINKQKLSDIVQNFLYETGVTAQINGWE